MKNTHTSRRGIAILLTMAMLVIVIVVVTALASRAASARFERELDRSTRLANELRRAADPVILDWLSEKSASVVLAADATTPDVMVLHHTWEDVSGAAVREYELRITAWDQCGMVPMRLAQGGSPLRLSLPALVLEQIDQADTTQLEDSVGLDCYLDPASFSQVSPFPLPSQSKPSTFSAALRTYVRSPPSLLPVDSDGPPAIGSLLATHQSSVRRRQSPAPRINVNTAPLGLVEAALREAGRGGIELIRAAREDGRAALINHLPRRDSSVETGRATPELLESSDVWAVRIDIRVNRIQRSWWRVYQKTIAAPGELRSPSNHLTLPVSSMYSPGGTGSSGANSSNERFSATRTSGTPSPGARTSGARTSGGWECVQSIVIPR